MSRQPAAHVRSVPSATQAPGLRGMLPFSEACERNKQPILEVLRRQLPASARVLEVGSGTGQHAVHFARGLPELTWQPSERPDAMPGLAARIAQEGPRNLCAPVVLDLADETTWPAAGDFDGLFTANTLHIVGWNDVQSFFRLAGRLFRGSPGAPVLVYGPFRYGGRFTTPSNEAFDRMLRERDPRSGLRDFEAVSSLADEAGFELVEDCAMPANNQTLVWRRRGLA